MSDQETSPCAEGKPCAGQPAERTSGAGKRSRKVSRAHRPHGGRGRVLVARLDGAGDVLLAVARAAGCELPKGDEGNLAVQRPLSDIGEISGHLLGVGADAGKRAYVVVHPGTSAPARTWPAERHRQAVRELTEDGHQVVVTGTERDLTAYVASDVAADLGGVTTFAELAAVIERVSVLVAGDTGPAHLAAVVGTPVVSLFAPVVPAARWAPHGVPAVLLGDQRAPCRGSRARTCPVPGHPCLSQVTSEQVVKAVRELTQ
ncbi:glycosyltransferase family 9 protein [Nonomuraea sp. NPDC046802]|uniref:glycosyltransferase family 9 protein n=1 Tax=Nonomuraea sp. NPDC046802 TaxID=3154919 RepID=UPI0034111DBC